MKFIALLLAAVSAAEVADKGDCSAADATCIAASCCGTAKDADGVADADKVATLITFFATVCSTKPADDATPAAVEIKAEVAICTAADVTADAVKCPAETTAVTPAVSGTFTCNAAADAAAASYMTVGAAAIIAAATLLQ
jgi:hypothetical protein